MSATPHPCCRNRETEVYNLGRRGRRNRLILGSILGVCSTVMAVLLVYARVHWLWKLSLFLPIFGTLLLLLQVRTRTCVVLAALGAWDLDCGTQRVPDPDLEKRLRHRAYLLVCSAFLWTLLVMAFVLIL